MRAARSPAAKLARGVHHLAQRAPERGGEQERRAAPIAAKASRPAPAPPSAASSRRLLLDAVQAAATRATPTSLPSWRIGHRRVEQVHAHGGAAAHRRVPAPPREGVLHLRAGRRGSRPRAERAPESAESASTRPSGATIVTRALDLARRGVHQARRSPPRRRPARQGLLDHAGHEPGLGQERRRACSRARRRAPGPTEQEHGHERGGGGHHRRSRRSAPQAKAAHSASSRRCGSRATLTVTIELREGRAASRAGAARGRRPCACPRRTSSPRRPPAGPGATARGRCASMRATSSANSLAVRCTALARARARRGARGRPRARRRRAAASASSSRAPGARQERAHARHQLLGAERLDHVVVGADLQADDAVGLVAARGEHHDRQAARARSRRSSAHTVSPSRPGSWRSRISELVARRARAARAPAPVGRRLDRPAASAR